jgi:cell wall-associated NlpC family hydrolase
MTPQEIAEGRARMVEEARSWIGTPYRVGGMVKGAGCCCGSLVLAVFQACGRALGEKFGVASSDCWQHWKEEQYQFRLMKHAVKIAEALTRPGAASAALPGCIALVRVGSNRCYNHAGIVTEWPMVVHSVFPEVAEVNASRHPLWAYRHVAVFDPFAEKPAEMGARA